MLQNNKELLNEKENISKPNEETLDENSLQKYARRTTWVFLGLVFSAILLVMKEFTPDSDAWFLAATGRYIVENQQVPVINPFTIHEGYSIIVQQWVVDVMNYLCLEHFGYFGLYIYSVLLFTLDSFLIYKYTGCFTENKRIRELLLLGSWLVLMLFANSRPTLLSFAILITELLILEKWKKEPSKWKVLLWLPLLSLAEINCHASMWPMMFVLILPYIFPGLNRFALKKPGESHIGFRETLHRILIKAGYYIKRRKTILLVIIAMFCVGFLNPNGVRGMFYLFLSYGNTYGGIMELQPPEFLSINGVIIIAGILALAFYLAKHKKGVDWTRVYMAAGTLLMACMHLRNMWFTILGILPIFIFSLESWIPSKYKIYHTKKEYHILQAVYSLLICFLFICMWPVFQYKTEDSVLTPVEAVEYLDENGYTPENVVLFTEFNNGAFMEWNGYKTYIDARPELYQHEINGKYDLYDEYLALRSNQIDYDDFLEKYDFTHIIIGDSEPFNVYLEYSDDYELVVDGNGYDLYQKNNF